MLNKLQVKKNFEIVRKSVKNFKGPFDLLKKFLIHILNEFNKIKFLMPDWLPQTILILANCIALFKTLQLK